jgi:hypothetical protein
MPGNDAVNLSELVPLTAGHSYTISISPIKLQAPATDVAVIYFVGLSALLNPVAMGSIGIGNFVPLQTTFGPVAQTGFGLIQIFNTNLSPTTVYAEDASTFQMVILDLGVL